jgi:hypothetical protein
MSYSFADSLRAASGWNILILLSAKVYDIYILRVYITRLLMMDRKPVQNAWSSIPKINLRN